MLLQVQCAVTLLLQHSHATASVFNCCYIIYNHTLSKGHIYGHISDALKILHITYKVKHTNILENFLIYNLSKQELCVNDTHTDKILTKYLNDTIKEEQNGFHRGRSGCDGYITLKLTDEHKEFNIETHLAYMEYKKAFARVTEIN
jgi:hypothetical protein